jgi:hypothetical protein
MRRVSDLWSLVLDGIKPGDKLITTGVQLLAEAARNSDLTFGDLASDRQKLAQALAEVQMPTPLGNFAFTPDHDVSQPIWVVSMDGGKGHSLVERLDPPGA